MKKKRVETFRKIYGMVTVVYIIGGVNAIFALYIYVRTFVRRLAL